MSDEAEEIEHSERGPSTAHRWRPCPASVIASRGIPNEAGIAAAMGTVFHEYAAICVEFGLDPQGFVGDKMYVKGFGWLTFDQEMADSMLNGLDLLWAMNDVSGAKMIVETKVNLEVWVGPGEFGTADVAIIDVTNWRIIVFDWKYGQGVPVSPDHNDQAILYALGTWSTFARQMFLEAMAEADGWDAAMRAEAGAPWEDDIEVIIMIEQPRAPGGGGTWVTTMGELLAEGERIRADADASLVPGAPFVPGPKQCQFCPAARVNKCKARAEMLLAEVGQDFDGLEDDFIAGAEMEVPEARSLTPEQRTQVLLHRSMIEKFLDQLHLEAYQDAKSHRPTPGLKLVPGRNPPRKWKDPVRAELMLEHDLAHKAFTKKLLSPTQVEGTVGKRSYQTRFAAMVDLGEAKPILVPESDKRQRLPDITSDFDDLENDDDLPLV
jgi:hypothetical protein